MSKLTKIISISALGAFLTIAPNLIVAVASFASQPTGIVEGVEASRSPEMPETLFGTAGIFTQVTNILLFLIGVLSVIMLIFGGLRYVISGGDSKAVEGAKNTILYAIVGLIVAILAYAIVNFVITTFVPNTGGTGGGYSAPASNGGGNRQPTNV